MINKVICSDISESHTQTAHHTIFIMSSYSFIECMYDRKMFCIYIYTPANLKITENTTFIKTKTERFFPPTKCKTDLIKTSQQNSKTFDQNHENKWNRKYQKQTIKKHYYSKIKFVPNKIHR